MVVTAGIEYVSESFLNSAYASEALTPPPAMINGLIAVFNTSTAFFIASGFPSGLYTGLYRRQLLPVLMQFLSIRERQDLSYRSLRL